jgi:phospholipid transport system substrate-binding protein
MSKRVMGRQWQNLSAAQQEEFVALFTELLQYIYIGQVDEYLDSTVEFGEQRIRGDRAEVRSVFVGPQKSIPVSYILILRGNTWMAYDIVVENISLIRNYMEQIQSVMHREQFAGLVKMLENKIGEMKEAARK